VTKYRITFKTSAAKEFRRLPTEIKQRLSLIIDELSQNPRPLGVVKLQGNDNLYRVRIGDYRVVYEIDDSAKLIRITRVRHRKDVYRQ
jgi:mRNA interferase RelE/StbE